MMHLRHWPLYSSHVISQASLLAQEYGTAQAKRLCRELVEAAHRTPPRDSDDIGNDSWMETYVARRGLSTSQTLSAIGFRYIHTTCGASLEHLNQIAYKPAHQQNKKKKKRN